MREVVAASGMTVDWLWMSVEAGVTLLTCERRPSEGTARSMTVSFSTRLWGEKLSS